jgi:hypothetical protein
VPQGFLKIRYEREEGSGGNEAGWTRPVPENFCALITKTTTMNTAG